MSGRPGVRRVPGRVVQAAALRCAATALACCAVLVPALMPDPAHAQAGNHACPPTVVAQYERVGAYAPDGARGATLGFTPLFAPPAPLRLAVAQLALAHSGEPVPSELLPPDELSYSLGRPMRWTLWDGRDPEPRAVVHLVCEYEGGLVLHRPLGNRIRACSLASLPLKPAPKTPSGLRELASKAVFSCR
jgi:hypothetical protein